MSAGSTPSPTPIEALTLALARQRAALIAGDPLALQACSEEVIDRLAELRADESPRSRAETEAIAQAHVMLRTNAEVLNRAIGINTRALAALFDAPPTYGPGGATGGVPGTRRLESA